MNAERRDLPFGSRVFEPGSEFVRLLYNRPSDCLIAHFMRVIEPQIPVYDLYYRRSSGTDYVKVLKENQTGSYCDPISCRGKPYVFFNIIEWDKAGVGSDWISTCRLSLLDGRLEHMVDSNGLRLPSGCLRGWINSLLDVNDEGTILTCKIALEFETGLHSSRAEYSIRDLDLATGEHQALARLPGVFV
jgi:hypothetical protein